MNSLILVLILLVGVIVIVAITMSTRPSSTPQSQRAITSFPAVISATEKTNECNQDSKRIEQEIETIESNSQLTQTELQDLQRDINSIYNDAEDIYTRMDTIPLRYVGLFPTDPKPTDTMSAQERIEAINKYITSYGTNGYQYYQKLKTCDIPSLKLFAEAMKREEDDYILRLEGSKLLAELVKTKTDNIRPTLDKLIADDYYDRLIRELKKL